MAKIVYGDLFQRPPDPGIIVVSGNNVIRDGVELVMGRGAALEARTKINGIDREAAEAILKQFRIGDDYGFLVVRNPDPPKTGFALLQTKCHYADPSRLLLVGYSLRQLQLHAWVHPDWNYRMNYPGIGNGRLDIKLVQPLIDELPDNITVVRFATERNG